MSPSPSRVGVAMLPCASSPAAWWGDWHPCTHVLQGCVRNPNRIHTHMYYRAVCGLADGGVRHGAGARAGGERGGGTWCLCVYVCVGWLGRGGCDVVLCLYLGVGRFHPNKPRSLTAPLFTEQELLRGSSSSSSRSSSKQRHLDGGAAQQLRQQLGSRRLDCRGFWAMLRIRTNMVLILQVGVDGGCRKREQRTHAHIHTHTSFSTLPYHHTYTHARTYLHPYTNIQALPGTIPWGVLFAYLNDFLSQVRASMPRSAAKESVMVRMCLDRQQASTLIPCRIGVEPSGAMHYVSVYRLPKKHLTKERKLTDSLPP